MAPTCNIITPLFLPAIPPPGALVYEITPLSVTGTVPIPLQAITLAGRRGGHQGRGNKRQRREMIRIVH